MTSKEALDNLYQGSLNPVNCVYATFRTGASEKITDDYNIIKKDLEVLEIIKKGFSKNFLAERLKDAYLRDDLNDEDYEKIKEWLKK